jgi:hypothetical protein
MAEHNVKSCHAVFDPHQELAPEDAVPLVPGLSGEIKLRRQHRLVRRLIFHVEMACAAGIQARHDRLEQAAPVGIGEPVAP